MKDFFWPGLILLVVATVALISTAATAAYRHYVAFHHGARRSSRRARRSAVARHREPPRDRIDAQWDAAHQVVGRFRASLITTERPVDNEGQGRPNRVCVGGKDRRGQLFSANCRA